MASWNKITAGDTLYDVRRSGSKREYWPVKVVSMDSVTETAMCQWNHNPARQYTRRQLEKLHVKRPGASKATSSRVATKLEPERTELRPMSAAPTTGPVVEILVATTDRAGCNGWLIVHYANGGGEEQPRFRGWFFWTGYDFQEADASKFLGWLPLPKLTP